MKSSVTVACFLPGRAKDLSAPLYNLQYILLLCLNKIYEFSNVLCTLCIIPMYLHVIFWDRTATGYTEGPFSCIFHQSSFLDLFPTLSSVLCVFWFLISCLLQDRPI